MNFKTENTYCHSLKTFFTKVRIACFTLANEASIGFFGKIGYSSESSISTHDACLEASLAKENMCEI